MQYVLLGRSEKGHLQTEAKHDKHNDGSHCGLPEPIKGSLETDKQLPWA